MRKWLILAGILTIGCIIGQSAPYGGVAKARDGFAANATEILRDGEYTSKDDVAAYIRKFNGNLPRNFITKAQARTLGWQGGAVEPFAPGKSIGGDRFGNYERILPQGSYRECDIDTRGRPRGAKRLVFTTNGKRIFYTEDHYSTFEEIKEEKKNEKRVHY